jgi:protein-arginine kinase activator protein McsA
VTYTIQKDRKAITCHLCGATSYNVMDVENLYCSGCKRFHADHPPSPELVRARETVVDQALGEHKTW